MSEYRRTMSNSIELWATNTESVHVAIQQQVHERIRYGSGYRDLNPDDYRQLHKEREGEIVSNISDVVQDTFVEMITDELSEESLAYQVLTDLLDLNNRYLWEEISERYVPDPDDYEEDYV